MGRGGLSDAVAGHIFADAYSTTPSEAVSQVASIVQACSRDNVMGLEPKHAIKSRFSSRVPPHRAGGNKVNHADRCVSGMKGPDAGLGSRIGDRDPLVLTQVL